MTHRSSRRNFLKGATAVGVGFWVAGGVAPRESRAANETINFACVGVGGKGRSDSEDARRSGNVVALCDVDQNTLNDAARRFEVNKLYQDYRKMFDEMGKSIDAITVSTPDHTHAGPASIGMSLGMHCFCQKPLTHTIWEARHLGELARAKGVATQMGNQGTASGGLRKAAALLRAGVLGTVSEVHVWTNRPIWAQGGPRPAPKDPPPHLDWDVWLGPAPERPYGDGYHPFAWRGWWDFGTGALGDMACHTLNMPFMGLDLKNPTSVVAETSGHNKDSYPKWSVITFEFPALGGRAPLKFIWYDGGKRPDQELLLGAKMEGSGALIIGDKARMYSPGDYAGGYQILPQGAVQEPAVEYPNSPGHFQEWVAAIKGGPAPISNFPDYAGPLTETVLLGNLAVWADGKKIEWDAKNLVATNAPEVMPIVNKPYRKGFEVV